MVNPLKNIKQLLPLARKNYLIILALICLAFVGVVSLYKTFLSKPVYVYAQVKVGQGLWWASTQRPSSWFIEAIEKAKTDKKASGSTADILDVQYYPWYGTGQYDVFLTVKLKVAKSRSGVYSYNRSTIGVGSPIDLEFRNVQFSGTITDLSPRPIKNSYVEKTVVLAKKGAFPWEAEAIKVGDTYYNGETTTLKILDKQVVDVYTASTDFYGNSSADAKKYITVVVQLKGQMIDGQLVYYSDQIVTPGRSVSLATQNFIFNDYTVAKVE